MENELTLVTTIEGITDEMQRELTCGKGDEDNEQFYQQSLSDVYPDIAP